jgi:hypothetical protein
MRKQSAGARRRVQLPPGWTTLHASTSGGARYMAVWNEFPDATPFEHSCATAEPVDWGRPSDGAGRVGALRKARSERPAVSEAVWQRLIRMVYPTLSEQERRDPEEILAAIAALRTDEDVVVGAPRPRREAGRPAWTEAKFQAHLREAESRAAPSRSPKDIAANFRAHDGTIGIDPDHLRHCDGGSRTRPKPRIGAPV